MYYGDEAGLCGFTDPDNRRTYPWGKEDQALIDFHKAVIRMHRENTEFKTGSLKWLMSDFNFMAYGRFNEKNHSVVLVNNNDCEIMKEISVWELGIPREGRLTRLIYTDEKGFDTEPVGYSVDAGRINVAMPKNSAMVLQYVEEAPMLERQSARRNFWQER